MTGWLGDQREFLQRASKGKVKKKDCFGLVGFCQKLHFLVSFFFSFFLPIFWTIWNHSFSLSHYFLDHLAWYLEQIFIIFFCKPVPVRYLSIYALFVKRKSKKSNVLVLNGGWVSVCPKLICVIFFLFFFWTLSLPLWLATSYQRVQKESKSVFRMWRKDKKVQKERNSVFRMQRLSVAVLAAAWSPYLQVLFVEILDSIIFID